MKLLPAVHNWCMTFAVIVGTLAAVSISAPLPAAERAAPEIFSDLTALPIQVSKMRDAILEAARSGDIKEMRPVLDSNELKPTVSFGGDDDPIKYWKQGSRDGQGLEIMAVMSEILEMDFARIKAGTSNEMYIWPYLAELPMDKLTPAQQVDLHRLMSPQEVKTMKKFGDYIHYRLGIGRDGTWHYFVAGD